MLGTYEKGNSVSEYLPRDKKLVLSFQRWVSNFWWTETRSHSGDVSKNMNMMYKYANPPKTMLYDYNWSRKFWSNWNLGSIRTKTRRWG